MSSVVLTPTSELEQPFAMRRHLHFSRRQTSFLLSKHARRGSQSMGSTRIFELLLFPPARFSRSFPRKRPPGQISIPNPSASSTNKALHGKRRRRHTNTRSSFSSPPLPPHPSP